MNTRIAAVLESLKKNAHLIAPQEHTPKKREAFKRARCPLLLPGRFEPEVVHARLVQALRSRTHSATKRKGSSKAARTIEMLGCSIQAFRAHLEARFAEGMSWENYGDWQIDHIKPCCAFDLRDPEQQKLCFHYSNLQPLWSEKNKSKGGRYTA